MKENQVPVILACSQATQAAIGPYIGAEVCVTRVDSAAALDDLLSPTIPGESTDMAKPWGLAICDQDMPDFTALDLIRRLSAAGLDIPVVVVEGPNPEEIRLECLAFGACQFIRLDERHLRQLPRLLDTLVRRARGEQARKELEQRLRESEERHIDIFDNTSDLIQCLTPDGRFLYTNRTWRETMGYSIEETQGLTLLDILHPDSLVCCQDRFQRLMNGETLSCITFKFRTKSGDTVHLLGDCGSIIKQNGAISTRGIFKNVTETVRVRDALRLTEARYQALYENAPDIFTILNRAGEILSINQRGARMLGYEPVELVGESIAKVIHPEDQQAVFDSIERYFSHPAKQPPELENGTEYRKVKKDGTLVWVHERVTLEMEGPEPRMLVVCRDVTEKHDLEAQLAHQASHDALTSLINRREFERRLARVLSTESEPGDHHALCFMDLDEFKQVNDTCGHQAGDELLRQIAALLESQVRSRDTLARLGGDEFVILMEHTSPEKALVWAEKILATIDSFKFHWRSQTFSVGVSIGVVPVLPGQSLTDTLNRADTACYRAKREGRNRICKEPGPEAGPEAG